MEPSGAAAIAALLAGKAGIVAGVGTEGGDEEGDVVVVISGRNVDDTSFARWISDVGYTCPGTR